MLKLRKFDENDYQRYPYVEDFCNEIVPLITRVQMGRPDIVGQFATIVVDGNGIQVMTYNEDGKRVMVFVRKLYPFPLAVFVAQHLDEPLDPEVLTRFGFERIR